MPVHSMQALPATFLARVGQLDRLSAVPLYYQLQEVLKQDIEAGNWAAGDLLPSEAELGDGLGVSRTVIRKALDILQADGQVLRQKGRGTVVLRPKQWLQARTTSRAWNAEDLDAGAVIARLIDARVTTAGHNLGRMLSVPVRSEVFELTTVSSVANHPVGLMQAFLPTDACPLLSRLHRAGRLPDVRIGGQELLAQLQMQYALPLHRSEIIVEATTANEFECDVLKLRGGSGMFLITTLEKDVRDVPVAFTRAVHPSAHFRFAASVVR